MALAITDEQEQLAAAVTSFAARHAPIDKTRASFDSIAAGELPSWWEDLTAYGFHAVHLPQSVGGQGGTMTDLGCVVEAAAAALLPGPLLSTTIASAVADLADDSKSALIAELAAGATAVVVLPDHSNVRAVRDGDAWRLDGTSAPTLGIVAAQRILLAAHTDGTVRWFVLAADGAGLSITRPRGTDLSTDVGILTLTAYAVPASAELTGISVERAHCTAVALTACASAGTVRRCAEAATDYIRTREQFGQPVGAFQALQHKAAVLFVNSELASAAAWDAIRACGDSVEQQRLAAGAAALTAVAAGPDLVLDALLMYGAVGYTWEHDTHLYWRRATSLAASIGSITQWARQSGELLLTEKRSTALNLGDVESEFRASVAATLDQARTLRNAHASDDDRAPGLAWGDQRDLLAEYGLVAPHLPPPWGIGASSLQQVIITEEFDKRPDVQRPSLGIAEWILPTILSHGTDAQRQRFAEPMLRGTERWCQLFSEPGAGSDLASLSTRARKVDGGWLINGHKIWTSLADRAQFGALLARTDPDAPKHRGISYFLIDMTSPGLTVEPIRQASGHQDFNEVFFSDVFVPDDMLVGKPGDGWNLAVATMAVERTAIGNYVNIDRSAALRHVARQDGLDRDAALQALGEIEAYTAAIRALVLRETLRLAQGQAAGPTSSIAKYAMVMLLRRASTATLRLTGETPLLEESEPAVIGPYLDMPSELIGGGTAEIQLTVIASMILGLPRK
ncbi:acyl-CoA dehydrogenase [Mycolicibacterium moriokaense]|uniref:Acyl-CoA dehydrogenase n=1 Tax=Mycolicibacterium moriokaense TaxID=39691 RepID=A0AAD1HF24_9MYCO|nr:acyl-CoA dehydrogenase [Mycolicibacterium moriokaense]MCV7039304.1 acyl-CoA dehydrogenase [Mycolicibacterium moriokaense]ORB26857.1 acyl-CoA dehydrogenase [Mycolicibacterium moriokaense]BBX03824.1 acyl-CoA dehydrogenase [Mycolicibacterium moriokaense]